MDYSINSIFFCYKMLIIFVVLNLKNISLISLYSLVLCKHKGHTPTYLGFNIFSWIFFVSSYFFLTNIPVRYFLHLGHMPKLLILLVYILFKIKPPSCINYQKEAKEHSPFASIFTILLKYKRQIQVL